jgi:GT2 family glycosyltransferase/glycosyltransferase involved in cell wall biosynthesis
MRLQSRYAEELYRLGVHVVTRSASWLSAADFVKKRGHTFGVFLLVRVDVAEAVLKVIRKAARHARIIFQAPDLYFLREMREAERYDDPVLRDRALNTRDREIAMMSAGDHVVLVSPAEMHVLRPLLPNTPISIFPGLYAPVREDPTGFAARRDVFFLGGFGHPPNVDAVQWFVTEVWPHVRMVLPEIEFHIVGAEAPASVLALAEHPGVKVIGYAPTLEPVLEAYRVGVAPLLYGAGIKGKVATTMGAGIPCVCTPIAAEGMGIQPNIHALIEDDPRQFARAVVSIYGDEALWTRLSRRGRDLVAERFGCVANRASLLTFLNSARALPVSMFCEYCKTAPLAGAPMLNGDVDVSIIIPVYNKWHLTRACLASVLQTSAGTGIRYEIILADDHSTDETINAAELCPGLRVVRTPKNLGFLRNCNNAAATARGRYVLFLNNDTIVLPGWLEALYQSMEDDPKVGIAGSKLLYPDLKIQEAGGAVFREGGARNIGRGQKRDTPLFNRAREVDYISGASILVRSTFWNEVGGFDERFKLAYCEDTDLAMLAREKGLVVLYQPKSEVIHFEHQSYKDQEDANHKALQAHNMTLFHEKWKDVLLSDHTPAHLGSEPLSVPQAARPRNAQSSGASRV